MEGNVSENSKAANKKTILDASIHTIALDKLSGTRMRRIAAVAGMSQGNLHYYFASKRTLILSLLDYMLEDFVRGRADQLNNPDLSPLEKLKLFFDEKIYALRERQEIMLVFYDLWIAGTKDEDIRAKMVDQYEVWRQDIERVVQEGVEQGVFDPNKADRVPQMVVSILEGAALQYLIDPEVFDLEGCFEDAYTMVLQRIKRSKVSG